MKRVCGALFLFAAGSLAAEDALRLPASAAQGQVRPRDGQVEITWPYGTITMPAPAGPSAAAERTSPPASPRAWNRGVFSLRYEFARADGFFAARNVRVTVHNRTAFRGEGSESLRAHEAMHRRINEAEARRLEKDLSGFRHEAADTPSGLKRADALFRREFRRRVDDIDRLHREWDKNHIPGE